MKKGILLKSMLLLFALIVGSSSVWATDVTYSIDSKGVVSVTGTAPSESSLTFTNTYINDYRQMTAGNSQTWTYSGFSGLHITKLVLSMKSNSSKGAGSLSYSIDGGDNYTDIVSDASFNSSSWYGSWSTSFVDITKDVDINVGEDDFILLLTSSQNSIYCTSIKITYEEISETTEWTVSYDGNGATSGTVPTDATVYDEDNNEVTVLGNTGSLAMTGYTFSGWNTQSDGEGTTYVAGNTFTISANTTLYAKWTVNSYNVTLPAADTYGTYTMSTTNPVAYGTEVTLTYTPASGYEIYDATWNVNGSTISGNTFTMPAEAVTVTVSVAEVVDYVTLPFNWEGGLKADLEALDGVSTYGLGSDYAEANAPYRVKFDNTGDYIQVKTDSQPGKVTIGVKMLGGSNTSKITVQGSSDGTTFTDVEELTISGSSNAELSLQTSNAFNANDRYVKLLFTKGSNVGVGPISIAKPTTDPVINAESTVNLAADATSGEIEYSITNPVSGTNLAASEDADWIYDVNVGNDKVTFTTSANTGAERSADITLTYGSVTKTVTVTQADGTPVSTTTYTLATSFVPGRHYIIVGVNNNKYKAMGAQGSNNRAAVEITVNDGTTTIASTAGVSEVLLGIDVSGYFTLYDENENGYLYASCGTGTSNTMNVESTLDDYGRWTISTDDNGALIIKAQAGQKNQLQYNSGNSLFSCYSATQKNVYLFERNGDTGSQEVTATIAAACTDGKGKYFGTYSAPFAFTVPSDVTVSEIAVIDNQLYVEDYEAGAVVPANTGVMISSSTAGSKTFTSAKGGTSVLDTDNCLRPTGWGISADDMSDIDPSCLYYRLTMHNGTQIGFWWGAAEGAAFDIAANKAYLAVLTSGSAPEMGMWIDDETTGIVNVNRETITNNQYYTLDGRRIAEPTKGLYIINGKKVVIK